VPDSSVITLTTDFGLDDTYVGQLKGAILGIDPDATIVDLCHNVRPHDVRGGAYALEVGTSAFAPGTIHVAVVDPGVGTARRMLAVRAGSHRFLAPDNGLLGRVLERATAWVAHAIQNRAFFGPRASTTFDARDVFGPVAAWVGRGVELERLGPAVTDLVGLAVDRPRLELGRATRVPVVAVDRFGNVVLDVTAEALSAVLGHAADESTELHLTAERATVSRFARTYGTPADREPFFLVNSAGYLEVAVASGRADEALGLRAGMHAALRVGR
jgi:S-adenosyl-L-methionine hydrolase (adenosine-forming)